MICDQINIKFVNLGFKCLSWSYSDALLFNKTSLRKLSECFIITYLWIVLLCKYMHLLTIYKNVDFHLSKRPVPILYKHFHLLFVIESKNLSKIYIIY